MPSLEVAIDTTTTSSRGSSSELKSTPDRRRHRTRSNSKRINNKKHTKDEVPTTTKPSASRCSKLKRMICLSFSVCGLAVWALNHNSTAIDLYTHKKGQIRAKIDDMTTLPLHPEAVTIRGIEHYYMLPHMLEEYKKQHTHGNDKPPPKPSINRFGYNSKKKNYDIDLILDYNPKGIFIFLHSCKRSGLEFFHLPEERIVALDALQRGLAVLAVSSQHRNSGCWTEPDIAWVGTVIDEWAMMHDLDDEVTIPRVAMAVSSAASFLFFVYDSLRLQAMAVINSPQSYESSSSTISSVGSDNVDGTLIPTVFVTMPKDEFITKEMDKNYKRLLQTGIPTQLYKVHPRPFTTELCTARIPELGKQNCDVILDTIRTDYPYMLDADGFVKEAMKSDQWQKLFTQLNLEHLLLEEEKEESEVTKTTTKSSRSSSTKKSNSDNNNHNHPNYYATSQAHSGHSWLWAVVEEEFSTCLAYHSMTAEHHGAILDFLMEQAGISMETDENDKGDQKRIR